MLRPILPHGRVRTFQIFGSILIFCTLLSTLRSYGRQPRAPSIYDYTDGKTLGTWLNETDVDATPQSEEASYLRLLVKRYELTSDIPWFAQRIRPQFNTKTRQSMTDVPSKFMSRGFQDVHADAEDLDLQAGKAVKLSLTRSVTPDQVDASSLIFGASSTYNRVTYANASLVNDWARWLTDGKGRSNGASLVLTLHRATSAEVAHVSDTMREVGIDATVLLPADAESGSTARYLELAHMLARRRDELAREGGRPEKRFLALLDDDVFLPSPGMLLEKLGRFDGAAEKVYLGLPGERADWTVEHNNNTTLTYGGGAVIFSSPMIDALLDLPCLNSTPSSETESYGRERRAAQWDELLYTCITAHMDQSLHILPSLYTPEDNDDSYGLRAAGYEGGVQPLALHHYRHRHRFEPAKAHLVASLCGEACFLQRFRFHDGWVLVNGHTVSQYPDGVDVLPLRKSSSLLVAQTRTQGRDEGVVVVKTDGRLVIDGGVGSPDERKVVSWAGTKRTWRLLDSRMGARGDVWQAYVKRRGSPVTYGDDDDRWLQDTVHTQDGPADVDSVIVLIWEA